MKNFTPTLTFLFLLCIFNLSKAQGQDQNSVESENASITFTYDNGWLPSNPLGIATSLDNIIIKSGIANITINTLCSILTIDPGAALYVASGITLTTDVLNLESTSQQYSSLISDGTIVGVISYHKHTEQLGINDLISPPISGQLFPEFAAENLNLGYSGFTRAFAPYNTAAGAYQNYGILSNASTLLEAGKGYRAATTDGGTLTFTGIPRTDDVLDISISDASAGFAWNLIGNPYPSYIDFETFFILNKSQFNTGTYQAIYGYDGDASDGWTVWNQASIDSPVINELIAPGQAFFVKAKSGGGLVDFTTTMRCEGSSDDFILGRSSSSPHHGHIQLKSSSSESNFSTDFYFNSNATQGFDPGYDSALFSENPPAFSIYSHLVEDNSGTPLAVQTFNPIAMYDVVIPLGVNASQGQEVTLSITETDMPEDIIIYLEDTSNNSFTLLNTNDYVFTANDNLTGTGRFYLRFSGDALSVDKSNFTTVNIWSHDKTINISGQLLSETKARLYDVNGRVVLTNTLNANSAKQTIDVSHISAGIYIMELDSKTNERRIEKLIIR